MRIALFTVAVFMLIAAGIAITFNYMYNSPLPPPGPYYDQHLSSLHRTILRSPYLIKAETFEEAALEYLLKRNYSHDRPATLFVGFYDNQDPSKEVFERLRIQFPNVQPCSHACIGANNTGVYDIETHAHGHICVLSGVEWLNTREARFTGLYGTGGGEFYATRKRWYWFFCPTGTEWCS